MDAAAVLRPPDPVRTVRVVRDRLRLAAVAALDDVDADPWCDRLAATVRAHLGAPVVMLSIVEPHRQRFVGCCGLPERWRRSRETPLSHSFCQYVVGRGAPLVVVDARCDPLLHDNGAVADLGVIAYAGAPLITDAGQVVGALCIIDHAPRTWTAAELGHLVAYATRSGRHLSRRRSRDVIASPGGPGMPPAAAPRRRLLPTATRPGLRVPAEKTLREPFRLPPAVRLDAKPAVSSSAEEMVFTGRFHSEAVTVRIRTSDTAVARQRFARCVEVYEAFGPTPPPVVAGIYRWSDDRTLVLREDPGTTPDTPPGPMTHLTTGRLQAIIAAVAHLSVWRPGRADEQSWHIDYPSMIDQYRRRRALTDGEADRVRDLAERCSPVRMFAHGNLVPNCLRQLPSRRITVTGFARAGMYLPGQDLATLYLALPHNDHAAQRLILQRVTDVDVLEPFTVNLLLAIAAAHTTPTDPYTDQTDRHDREQWLALWQARRLAHSLVDRLAAEELPG